MSAQGFTLGQSTGATFGQSTGGTLGADIPRAIQSLTVTQGSAAGEADLSWAPNDTADEYVVYRATTSGTSASDYTQVATATSASYTDTGLEDGEQYFYRVTARNHRGESGLSPEDSAITLLPAPTDLSVANIGPDSADLNWTNNHNNGTVTVQYRRSSDSTWQDWATGLSLSTESETLTGLLDGEEYDARILAVTEHAQTEDA